MITQSLFRPRTPFHMVWLATNACNARCLHCSSAAARRLPDELDTWEALRLMDELADFGVVDIAVSGGEPLLRADLGTVIQRARARGLSVGIGTNGAALTEPKASELVEWGVGRVQISLDGLKPDHDALRQWPGLFDRAIEAVRVAAARGLPVHVCCTVTKLNVSYLEPFTAFVSSDLPVRRLNFSRYVPTGRESTGLDLDDRAWRGVVTRIAKLRASYRGRLDVVTHLAQEILVDDEVAAMPGFIGCQAGRGQGCISATGWVFPCVLLPVPLGNIRQSPLREIWANSDVIAALQDRTRLEGACGRCPVVERCGGCRAVAFARSGRVLAEDPRCWSGTLSYASTM